MGGEMLQFEEVHIFTAQWDGCTAAISREEWFVNWSPGATSVNGRLHHQDRSPISEAFSS